MVSSPTLDGMSESCSSSLRLPLDLEDAGSGAEEFEKEGQDPLISSSLEFEYPTQTSQAYSAPALTPTPAKRRDSQIFRADAPNVPPVAPLKPEKGQPTFISDSDAWRPFVERYKEMDRPMIEAYNDEISTLLVFGGLFSAILTAFIVQSYQLLQEDFTQTSALVLASIALKINALPPETALSITGLIQSSSSPLDSFHAPVSAVCLNILWFLSLVLSLASTFFGIIIKQGLREYMTWTEVTVARDAVHLRQFRFNAFEKWNVSRVVGALPVLLEIAVVLFMCGLLVLLWTLHRVLAIIISIIVGIFFLTSFAIILLPSYSNSCPFKSPMALAFMSVCHSALLLTFQILGWLSDRYDFFIRPYAFASKFKQRSRSTASTWKDMDLHFLENMGQGLLYRSILDACSTRTDDSLLEHAACCMRGLINQPHKIWTTQGKQLVVLQWTIEDLKDLLQYLCGVEGSEFATFCKVAYGCNDLRWQVEFAFGYPTTSSSSDACYWHVRNKIALLPSKLAASLSNIIMEKLCNVGSDVDAMTKGRKTLVFACCVLCSLQLALDPDDEVILAESRLEVLRQIFRRVPIQTFRQAQKHDPAAVPIQDLFVWLLNDSLKIRSPNQKPTPGFVRNLISLTSEIGTSRADNSEEPMVCAVMILSMRVLQVLRKGNLPDPELKEATTNSIRFIEETIKYCIAHGIVNCGTPSIKDLWRLENLSEHISDSLKETILSGMRMGILTWRMFLDGVLNAIGVDDRERQECVRLQELFKDGMPLPPGWRAGWRTRRPYFVDHNTKTATWADPRLGARNQPNMSDSGEDSSKRGFEGDGHLPPGWEKRWAPRTDGYFYFLHDGNETVVDPRYVYERNPTKRLEQAQSPPPIQSTEYYHHLDKDEKSAAGMSPDNIAKPSTKSSGDIADGPRADPRTENPDKQGGSSLPVSDSGVLNDTNTCSVSPDKQDEACFASNTGAITAGNTAIGDMPPATTYTPESNSLSMNDVGELPSTPSERVQMHNGDEGAATTPENTSSFASKGGMIVASEPPESSSAYVYDAAELFQHSDPPQSEGIELSSLDIRHIVEQSTRSSIAGEDISCLHEPERSKHVARSKSPNIPDEVETGAEGEGSKGITAGNGD